MKVMAVNSSPRGQGRSKTELMLSSLVKGMTEAGAQVETVPFEVWMDIMSGKADGQQMFMEQKYQTLGDLNLLMRISELFGR